MAVKRNRWLVISVLVVAVGAFLAISLLPLLTGSGGYRQGNSGPAGQTPPASSAQEELEARARGYALVLEREPDNQTAIQGLVDARIQLGDLEGVVEPLTKLAELNPEIPDYQILLGQTYQALGSLDEAATTYRTVLSDSPGNMNALQGLVALLLQQERPQAAIALLEDTLQTAPQVNEITPDTIDVVATQLLLAQVHIEEENTEAALRIYDDVIPQAEGDFRPVLAKALVLQETDRAEEAAPLFQQAEDLAPAQFKDRVRQMVAGATGPAVGTSTVGDDEPGAAVETDNGAEATVNDPVDVPADTPDATPPDEESDGFIE